MRSKNLKPSSKFFVSTSSEESSSSDRTIDASAVISTVTADNPAVSSGRDVGLHARNETRQFLKYPKNVDVAKKLLQYKKSLDREWGHYVMNIGLWFRTLVRPGGNIEHYQVVYGLSIPLTFFQKGLINALKSCSGQLNGNVFEMMRVCESLNKKWKDGGIRREKRLKSVVEKVQRAHQNGAMATSGFAYAKVMEIPACVVGTSSSLVRRPRVKMTLSPSEQTAPVRIPPVGTVGVDADANMPPPLKKQKKESGKDVQASLKGANLEVVEQKALDLAKRDPIRLDTQIRSSISQLSVAWKLAAKVLKLAATDRDELVQQHDVEKAALREQFEKEKVLQREMFE
ncbi:hypothetical protein GIB67_032365 [Kingdonia uniflora]|uniref:Uncharacterized protein n=1 Tax=Kingdonia uniflora TaxID=39325 RepID=A0A7J7MIN0_9MAGN|nr:hypothetical protein GIB67_032365 [Kingdonia uniflora]